MRSPGQWLFCHDRCRPRLSIRGGVADPRNGFKLRSSEYSGGRGMSCEWRRLLEMDGDEGRRVTLPDDAWEIV